jgi:hypothetical protein
MGTCNNNPNKKINEALKANFYLLKLVSRKWFYRTNANNF